MNTTGRFARRATTVSLTAVLVAAGTGGATAAGTPHDFARTGGLRASATAADDDWISVTGPPRSITAEWVETTDKPTGISVKMPGKAETQEGSFTLDSKSIQMRIYKVEDGNKRFAFEVADTSGTDVKDALGTVIPGAAAPVSGTVTSNRATTVDGHPAREGRITFNSDGVPSVILIRVIAADGQLVVLATSAPTANEKGLNVLYKRFTSSLRIP
ncbi:hypothetical protein ACWGI8_29120 [Streptomyces sp. NPDC054841]